MDQVDDHNHAGPPARTLLQGGVVITLSELRPDAEELDVLVEGGQIRSLAPDLSHEATANTDVIDLSGRIICPGFVNAHLHTWQTALRSTGADWTLMGYLTAMHGGIAGRFAPADLLIANRAGALGQIDRGTTTVGDWCHNSASPEHADAAIEGLLSTGIRSVFLHGTPYRSPDVPHPIEEIDRLMAAHVGAGGLLTVGMASQGPQYTTPEVAVHDVRAARHREIVVSAHQSGGEPSAAWHAVREAGLLGPHLNVVHGMDLPDDWLTWMLDAGVTFTSTPENELGQGHGHPIISRLLAAGAAPSLGTDTEAVVPADILTAARLAVALGRASCHDEHRRTDGGIALETAVHTRQALEWITVEGARALGLADRIGRVEVGMQADLVVVDPRNLTLWPALDPLATVLHATRADIDAVMIGGAWRKRDGEVVGVDRAQLADRLADSARRLRSLDAPPS